MNTAVDVKAKTTPRYHTDNQCKNQASAKKPPVFIMNAREMNVNNECEKKPLFFCTMGARLTIMMISRLNDVQVRSAYYTPFFWLLPVTVARIISSSAGSGTR